MIRPPKIITTRIYSVDLLSNTSVLGNEALARLQEVDVVAPGHALQVAAPPPQLADLRLQFSHQALGPALRLPLLLLDGRGQLGLSLPDGAHQVRHHLRAFLHLPLGAGLEERQRNARVEESSDDSAEWAALDLDTVAHLVLLQRVFDLLHLFHSVPDHLLDVHFRLLQLRLQPTSRLETYTR